MSEDKLHISNLPGVFDRHGNWPEVKRIVSVLNKQGFTAYLAGGCVRDALLGKTPKDFDVACSARPEEVLKLFPNSDKRGKAFGVVAVFCAQGPVEVATFRKDGPYRDGRRPEYVEFLSDKEDALRRDFTINALFYDLKTDKVIDYTGGVKDLQKKIIRTVGEPEQRFREDYLRILRAFRFSIRLGFTIEPLTLKALLSMKEGLLQISRERVYEESLQILRTGNFKQAVKAFKNLDLLSCFLAPLFLPAQAGLEEGMEDSSFWTAPALKDFSKKNVLWMYMFFPFLMQGEGTALTREGRWVSQFSQNFREWKFPTALIKAMNNIFYSACCVLDIRPASLGKKLRILNGEYANEILFLSKNYLKSKKQSTATIDELEKEFLLRTGKTGKLPLPLVDGCDLKAYGVPEDKSMADMLDRLYDIQLEQKITDKQRLLKELSSRR